MSADAPDEEQPPFSAELARWRSLRRMSKKQLAAVMGFDASYLSHVEAGRMNASELFARKAEEALNAGGELAAAWRHGDAGLPPAGGLIVEDDHAELVYDGAFFRASQRRLVRNNGPEPVTRYLMRISVDRYPGQPERSNALYRARPLTWDQLGLTASCDRGADGLAGQGRQGHVQGGVAVLRERPRPVPALPRPAGHRQLLLHRR